MECLIKTPFTKATSEINRKLENDDGDFFSLTQGKKNKSVAVSLMKQTYFELHKGITTCLVLLSGYHIYNVYIIFGLFINSS